MLRFFYFLINPNFIRVIDFIVNLTKSYFVSIKIVLEFSFVMSYKTKIFSKVDKFFMLLNINLLFLIFLLNIKIKI